MKLALRSPCPVRPCLTPSGDRKSACALCTKTVHHLSRMNQAEGQAVLDNAGDDSVCVRYVADRDGSVVFAPALRRAAAAGMLAFAPVALADGGDLAVQIQAEHNRIQNELRHIGVAAEQVSIEGKEEHANAAQAHDSVGTELQPDVLVLYDGGI